MGNSSPMTQADIETYKHDGFLGPVRLISPEEAAAALRETERYEREVGPMEALHMKSHIYFSWLWKIARDPRVLDAITKIMGPNVLVLASRLWIKNPGTEQFVSWHQDVNYFGIEPANVTSNVWIALTDASVEAGCMRFLPGSHTQGLIDHEITMDANNLLTRGQTVHGVDVTKSLAVPLAPGEASFHHGNLLHCSPPNQTNGRRIGYSLILLPTYVKSTTGRRTATLLCGKDEYGYWDLDPEPTCDRDPAILERMHLETKRYVPEKV